MPIDPGQLSQDSDFLKAAPADQVGYLSAQDPDFAKASPQDQQGYLQHLTGRAPVAPGPAPLGINDARRSQPAPQAPNLGSMAKMPGAPAQQPVQGDGSALGTITSAASNVSQIPSGLANMVKSSWMDKPQEGKPTAGEQILSGMNPANAVANNRPGDPNSGIDWGATGVNTIQQLAAAHALAPEVEGAADSLAAARKPVNPMIEGRYSPAGDQIAGSLRSNSRIDMPAEAHAAVPAMREAASDLGINPEKDFQGRNGPVATQRIIDHAIDINEARNKMYIDPIRGTEVAPDFLAKNPDLAARFTPEQIKKGITYGDIDNERIQMNKELRRSGLYSQDLSKQYATQLESLERAAGQARDSVYGEVGKVTGKDLRASKQIESSLIKVADTAETTKNTLAQQEAKYQNTPMTQRVLGSVKRLVSIKANPTNAFEPGISSPTEEFNGNMGRAFQGVRAAPGSIMKNGKLTEAGPAVLTPPPGQTPPAPNAQETLNMRPGEHGFQLIPPAGQAPPAPAQQFGLPGIGRGGADLNVPPQPTLPANIRRSLGAAAAAPAQAEVPGDLRGQIPGLERRATPRSSPHECYRT